MSKIEGQGASEGDYEKSPSDPIDQLIDSLKGLGKSEAAGSHDKMPADSVISATGRPIDSEKIVNLKMKPETPKLPMYAAGSEGMEGIKGNPWLQNQYAVFAIIMREWAREQMKAKFEMSEYKAEQTLAIGESTRMRAETTIEIGKREMLKGILTGAISAISGMVQLAGARKTMNIEAKASTKYDDRTSQMGDNNLYSAKKDSAMIIKSELETKKLKLDQKNAVLEQEKIELNLEKTKLVGQENTSKYKKIEDKLEKIDEKIEKNNGKIDPLKEDIGNLDKIISTVDEHYANKTKLEQLQETKDAMERKEGFNKDAPPQEYLDNQKQITETELSLKTSQDIIKSFSFTKYSYNQYETNKEKHEKEQQKSISLEQRLEQKKNDPNSTYRERADLEAELDASRAKALKFRERMEKFEPGSKNLKEMMDDLHEPEGRDSKIYNDLKNKKAEVDVALQTRDAERTKTIGDETTREFQYLNMITQGSSQILNALKEITSGAIENEKAILEAEKQLLESLTSFTTQGRDLTDEQRKQFGDDITETMRSLNQLWSAQTKIGDISNR